jgi:hypothetical protein
VLRPGCQVGVTLYDSNAEVLQWQSVAGEGPQLSSNSSDPVASCTRWRQRQSEGWSLITIRVTCRQFWRRSFASARVMMS